ncbi:MAG: TonB-dependent receptor [Opitutales bacterium]|nr:TonB-dependent receptor [Opitutales bacterium]
MSEQNITPKLQDDPNESFLRDFLRRRSLEKLNNSRSVLDLLGSRKLRFGALAGFLSAMSYAPMLRAEEELRNIINLDPVVVTATKREESQQEIPISVSALGDADLKHLKIENLNDYIELLPNVNIQGTGPGQNELYIRGAATSQTIITLSSVQGLQPSVALYLDEQPVSMQGRNLDVYAADMKRIEVLPGPQGTLFGASSQAGTVRLITNKPHFDYSEAGFEASYSTTKGGDSSQSVQGFVNQPITDDFAVRLAFYNDREGGWIDNILNDPENGGWNGSAVVVDRISGGALPDPENQTLPIPRNDHLVEENFNDATYSGIRLGMIYRMDEDWNFLVQHTQQTLETEGVWAYDPNLEGESSVNRFAPDENDDEFGLTTWTLEGRLNMLDLIYTGGYLQREITSTIDYTFYTNGGLFSAYYVFYPGDGTYSQGFDPSKFYKEDSENTRLTHELRVTTPAEERIRAIGGLFYDTQELASVGLFKIASTDSPYFSNLARTLKAPPGTEGTNTDGGPFGPEISFVNDVTRTTDQIAAFGQVEFDITDKLTFGLGARYYDIEDDYKGSTTTVNVTERLKAFGVGTEQALIDALGAAGGASAFQAIQSGQLDVADLDDNGVLHAEDVIYKASLDWRVNEDIMLFANYSQGFRPPVTNRVGGGQANNQTGVFEGFRIPVYSQTDDLENYEVGMKSELLDNTLRLNMTAYKSEIKNLQTSRFDPTNINFLWFADNVGDAEIKGLDAEFTYWAAKNLIISGAASFLDTEITRLNAELQGIAAPVGSELPFSADFSGSLRAFYQFEIPDVGRLESLMGYLRGTLNYKGESLSGLKMDAYVVEDTMQRVYQVGGSGLSIKREADAFLGAAPNTDLINEDGIPGGRYIQEASTVLNLAIGVAAHDWTAELFVDNVTNETSAIYIDAQQFTPHVVTNRPRTVGVKFTYDFY